MKLNLKYIEMLIFKYVEKIKNRHNDMRWKYFKRYEKLIPWTGANFVYIRPGNFIKQRFLRNYYAKIKGNIADVKFLENEKIAYDDHLPRIRTKDAKIDTAIFIKPAVTAEEPLIAAIEALTPIDREQIENIVQQYSYFSEPPQPFDYNEMEAIGSLRKPVKVGLPHSCGEDFIFNQSGTLTSNVLHLPVKISKAKSIELINQGRILSNGDNLIAHDQLYLPDQLKSLLPIIQYACGLELKYNPYFIDDYYIFITVSNSIVETGKMQRRGGWHIDGHQGHERMHKNGIKLRCDRQYLMSNALPTESFQHQFDFSNVRNYCKRNFCHMDGINMQDVIENAISNAHEKSKDSAIFSTETNRLYYLNPYMVHRAKVNTGSPVERTFLRILVSTFKRDRLGDTVNPVIGPLWRYKIKTITDIHEMEHSDEAIV